RCCNTACNAACQTCATGTCVAVTNADDTGTCTGNMTCNGTGACLLKLGQVSPTAGPCPSNLGVDGRCCGTACNGSCQTCANATGTCGFVVNADDPVTCTGAMTCNPSGP